MNAPLRVDRLKSTCPHDCPSACSLEVEVIDGKTIGRVHGDPDQSYTAASSAPRWRAMPSASTIPTGCSIR